MSFSDPPKLVPSFTINIDCATPHSIGPTVHGDRRFIPINGGTITGPRLNGKILPGGGDWNLARPDGIFELYAKYTLSLPEDDGSETLVTITNEGIGRASQEFMDGAFGPADSSRQSDRSDEDIKSEADTWYTRTSPKFEVRQGSKYQFLCKSLWLGVLRLPEEPGKVVIDVFRID